MNGNPLFLLKVPLRLDGKGRLLVGSTQVSLNNVILATQDGLSAEAVVSKFPSLALKDVHAVIAYWLSSVKQVEQQARWRNEELVDSLERGILGNLLLDPDQLAQVAARLRVADFSAPRHQLLYGAMLALRDQGAKIDLGSISSKLTEQGKLDLAGGLAYIATLDLYSPDVTLTEDHVTTLQVLSAQWRQREAESMEGGPSVRIEWA